MSKERKTQKPLPEKSQYLSQCFAITSTGTHGITQCYRHATVFRSVPGKSKGEYVTQGFCWQHDPVRQKEERKKHIAKGTTTFDRDYYEAIQREKQHQKTHRLLIRVCKMVREFVNSPDIIHPWPANSPYGLDMALVEKAAKAVAKETGIEI